MTFHGWYGCFPQKQKKQLFVSNTSDKGGVAKQTRASTRLKVTRKKTCMSYTLILKLLQHVCIPTTQK